MGQWMRDGSYQYDDSDIAVREAMNETQGQYYDRIHRHDSPGKSWSEKYDEELRREREYAQRVEERSQFYERANQALREEERRKEREQQRKAQCDSFDKAKARFKKLNAFQRLWLNITRKGINSYSPNDSVETLDSLYGGRSR